MGLGMEPGESGIHQRRSATPFLGKNLAHLLFNVRFPYGGASEHDYLFAVADVDGMCTVSVWHEANPPTLPPDASQALVGGSMPLDAPARRWRRLSILRDSPH